jgi:hypothetical protein
MIAEIFFMKSTVCDIGERPYNGLQYAVAHLPRQVTSRREELVINVLFVVVRMDNILCRSPLYEICNTKRNGFNGNMRRM